MAERKRYNQKKKMFEYKKSYIFYVNGVKHESDTRWCSSEAEAKREAKRLSEIRTTASEDEGEKTKMKLEYAFLDFIDDLKRQATKDKVENATFKNYWREANTIFNKYMPNSYKGTKMTDINATLFRNWIDYMNDQPQLGGKTIRAKKNIIVRFNKFLFKNNYYTNMELHINIETAISKAEIKSVREHNKEDSGKRNVIEPYHLNMISNYYMKTIENFRSFYYYTLFYVAFFGGMREEEIIALQWKNVDLIRGEIKVNNAISEKENREEAIKRTLEGHTKLKNKGSERTVYMFDFYGELLEDYRESYIYEFGIENKEQLDEGFVFPNLSKHERLSITNSKALMREIHTLESKLSIPKTDFQMLRHSCAHFLVRSKPQGLGYSLSEVKDHFGHEDEAMLEKVYAKLKQEEKAIKQEKEFSPYRKSFQKQTTEEEVKNEDFITNVLLNNEKAKQSRKRRITVQVNEKSKNPKYEKKYYYSPKDKDIIDELIPLYTDLEFIERTI